MNPAVHQFLSLDLWPIVAGTLAAVTCGLLGNFLVLRRQSLMGDAISHAVLPGLVIAFLLAGTRSAWPMFVGAALAGVATVVLVEVVRKLGRVEPGAAMGVVFSVLFALGVLLLEQAAARHVDLDADCVLHGQLETLFWFPPSEWGAFWDWLSWSAVPRQVWTLLVMAALASVLVTLLFKELRVAAFDPALATSQGFHAGVLHYVLMVFVAAATVASFEAVGSILVIAMLIVPAAAARLLTDRLGTQIGLSVVVAVLCGTGGYASATALPAAWGGGAVNAAGAMTVVSGALLLGAVMLSPSHGVFAKAVRRRRLSRRVALDDLLAALYRLWEQGQETVTRPTLAAFVPASTVGRAESDALRHALITTSAPDAVALTDEGMRRGAALVRRHRLWETYLVDRTEQRPDHVHDTAERFEHFGVEPPAGPRVDPHGRPIPDVSASD